MNFRFTNAYRAADRVSQFLIRNVIYREDLPSSVDEVVFRVVLFKLFNRIDTWQLLENAHGPITLSTFRMEEFARTLSSAQIRGERLYSAAYIMPSTGVLGESVKHRGHLRLVEQAIRTHMPERLAAAPDLKSAFSILLSYPTLGEFLSYQLAIDINYSEATKFSEDDFVVAGPGARDGIRKCFLDTGGRSDEDIIRWVMDRQDVEPARLGLRFQKLFGRHLSLIDVQNLFCEVGKYARIKHPRVKGTSDRSRIKQGFRPGRPTYYLFFPPKWAINDKIPAALRTSAGR